MAAHRQHCRACATYIKSNFQNFTFVGEYVKILADSETGNCSQHVADIFAQGVDGNINSTSSNYTPSAFERIEEILFSKVVVVMCFMGLFGNMLNLFVLVPRGLRYASGRMEKFAYSGLIALALSNMLFCLTTIPYGFLDKQKLYTELSFALLFHTYNNAIINTFILSSTWLTVTLAVGRYLAVCFPLKARELMGLTCARRSIISVVTMCVLFNIPRFFTFSIETAHCADGIDLHFQYYGYMKLNKTFDMAFNWTYFVFGIIIPLILMTFCNSYLIYALRLSRLEQNRIRASKAQKETSNHMTLTLIVIIVMYIVLVIPAEMTNFLHQGTRSKNPTLRDLYNFAVAIVNTLQAFNFAFSFIPYCAINAHFRKMMARFFGGKCFYKMRRNATSRAYKDYTFTSDVGTTELDTV